MLIEWFSQNIVPSLAVIISAGTLVFTNIEKEATTNENLSVRTTVIEKQMTTLPSLEYRLARLETNGAVTNQILSELGGAVTELNSNTKELTSLVTKVAVLDQKVNTLESRALREDNR